MSILLLTLLHVISITVQVPIAILLLWMGHFRELIKLLPIFQLHGSLFTILSLS
jgi:hypothetical protein